MAVCSTKYFCAYLSVVASQTEKIYCVCVDLFLQAFPSSLSSHQALRLFLYCLSDFILFSLQSIYIQQNAFVRTSDQYCAMLTKFLLFNHSYKSQKKRKQDELNFFLNVSHPSSQHGSSKNTPNVNKCFHSFFSFSLVARLWIEFLIILQATLPHLLDEQINQDSN